MTKRADRGKALREMLAATFFGFAIFIAFCGLIFGWRAAAWGLAALVIGMALVYLFSFLRRRGMRKG